MPLIARAPTASLPAHYLSHRAYLVGHREYSGLPSLPRIGYSTIIFASGYLQVSPHITSPQSKATCHKHNCGTLALVRLHSVLLEMASNLSRHCRWRTSDAV